MSWLFNWGSELIFRNLEGGLGLIVPQDRAPELYSILRRIFGKGL